jgi:16S rRNA (guanine(1405)-N(7))-methyltransferase
MNPPDDRLTSLVESIRASANYRRVSEDLIRRIGARELDRRRSLKEAVAATRAELHQIGGAYLDRGVRYQEWLALLAHGAQGSPPPPRVRGGGVAQPAAGDVSEAVSHPANHPAAGWRAQRGYVLRAPEGLRPVCAAVMRQHASTRERLPILEEFYTTTLAGIAPVHRLLDVACGFNPLAIPWMPLAPDAEYYACDIYEDLIAFVNEFFSLAGVRGRAEVADVATSLPRTPAVDVALLLKTLPCLEQTDRSASLRLLETIPAAHLLVSFPVRSLGGRQKGMIGHYEAHFRELIAGKSWPVQRFEFATELAFLVRKGGE